MAQAVRFDGAPAPIGPYSQAIRAGDELYCSGQVGLDPATGELVGSDVESQTRRTLQNLGAVLAAASMDFSNVVKTTIFLTDMNDFAAVNAIYAEVFEKNKPARTTVAVAGLPKGARIEIDAIAKA